MKDSSNKRLMSEIDKKRVLIVEDNPYILKLLGTMLELENLEVITATDGEDALHLIMNESKGKFDLVVTDYHMTKITGQEFAETLKLYDEYHDLPIVLITQETDIRYENNAKYRVFDKILYKPITKNSIAEIKNIFLKKDK